MNVKSLYERKVSAVGVHKGFFALFLLFFAWITGKFFLPFLFPFLLGTGLAFAAEPAVSHLSRRLKLGRGCSAGLGVTATLLLLLGLVFLLGAIAVRELGIFARQIPAVYQQGATLLESALTDLSAKAPDPVGPVLTNSIHNFFRDTSALTDQAVQKVPGVLSGILGKLPNSAMALGTGVLSSYFISARLPKLKTWAAEHTPKG